MAENRQRTVLEIRTDQTQAEQDIKRLQDMVDRLQQSASNIGLGGVGGGAGSGGGGGGPGAAPAPPPTGLNNGAPTGTGGGAPAMGGGGPGGGGAPAPPATGSGAGGGATGGDGGDDTDITSAAAGMMAGRRMGLGGLARIGGAALIGKMAMTGATTYAMPTGYTSRGTQTALDVAGDIPIIGGLFRSVKQGMEGYGQQAHQLGDMMAQEGMLNEGGFAVGLTDPQGTNFGGTDFMGRSFGTPIDTTARDLINYGYNAQERIRMGNQVQMAAGRSVGDYNLSRLGRMRRGGLEADTVGQFIRGAEEFGLTGVGGDVVDVLGRKGVGGVEAMARELQTQGYRGAALDDMMKEHARNLVSAGQQGLQRDVGVYTQQLSDFQLTGVGGRKASMMAQRGASTMSGMIAEMTAPYKEAGMARIRAEAARGTTTMAEQIRNMEQMTTGDQVAAIQKMGGGSETQSMTLKALFPSLQLDEAEDLGKGYVRGAGTVDEDAPMRVAGGYGSARAAARGELGVFRSIDKGDINQLVTALYENKEATIQTGKTLQRMFGSTSNRWAR